MIIESCVDSYEKSLQAQQNGASQLELCSRLDLDGLSPDFDLTEKTMANIKIPIKVMLRPRPGDFQYSDSDKAEIRTLIDTYKQLGVRDFVYGSMKKANLDLEDIEKVILYITKDDYTIHSFTIHKAIDIVTDPLEEIDLIKAIAIRYQHIKISVLSSGQCRTALEGANMLNKMIKRAGSDLEIIAAGNITAENLDLVKRKIGASAFHGQRIVGIDIR